MVYMVSGTQAQLATALNGFARTMSVGLTPVGFLQDGGIEFIDEEAPAFEPTPILVPPAMMPFNSGNGLTELNETANFVTDLAARSGEGGSRFIDVMRDLQAALTLDGEFKRGKGGQIVGRVGEVVDGAEPSERSAARGMIRELKASQKNGLASFTKTVRAMKSWHDYALSTDAGGPLKRHALSRSIWHGLTAERTRYAGQMMAILGDFYNEEPLASPENAILNYLRSAIMCINSDVSMVDVHNALEDAVEGWGSLIEGLSPHNSFFSEAKSLAIVSRSFSHMANWGDGYAVVRSPEDLTAISAIESGNYVYVVTPAGELELRLGAAGMPHRTLQLDPDSHYAIAAGRWAYDDKMGALFFDGQAPDVHIHPDQEFIDARTGSAYSNIIGSHSTGYSSMISRLREIGIAAFFDIEGVSSR